MDNAIRLWAQTVYENALNKADKILFLDKTPRYYYIIPDLYRLFPKAKFIFLLRNPMAVLASELHTYINGHRPFMNQIADDLVKAPQIILDGIDLLGSNAIVIRYEEFVRDPQENISRLCSQLGVTFTSSMLDYSKTYAPKGKLNDPIGIHKHTKPSSSVEKWKKMADDPEECHLAISYLLDLGEATISRYSYSYEEIVSILNSDSDEEAGNHVSMEPGTQAGQRDITQSIGFFRPGGARPPPRK